MSSHYFGLTGYEAQSGEQDLRRVIGTTAPVGFDMLMLAPYRDTDGIPLSSDRAKGDIAEGIDFRYQPCPYPNSPSRIENNESECPVPMSGLEQERLRKHFKDVVDIARAFRTEVAQGREEGLYAAEVGLVFGMVKFLPHYLVFRADNPVPIDQLDPKIVIAANSASGSLGALFGAIEDSGDNDILKLFEIPNTDEMINASENLGTLIGEKTVCAASPGMMRGFIGAVVDDREPVQLNDVLGDLITPEELLRLAVFVDVTQSIDQELLKRYSLWMTNDDEKQLLEVKVQQINQSHKKARIKGVQVGKIRAKQKQLDRKFEEADAKTHQTVTHYHRQLNATLGRAMPVAHPMEKLNIVNKSFTLSLGRGGLPIE